MSITSRLCPACHSYHPPLTVCGQTPAPLTPEVTLTAAEMRRAYELARSIVHMDVAVGWRMYFDPGGGESRLDVNVRGFAAEIAAARYTGLARNEAILDTTYRREQKPHDLGQRTEVRSTRRHDGALYLYRADPVKDRLALLVTGSGPVFRLPGWIAVAEGKASRRWRAEGLRHPAYVIHQQDLHPLPLPADA